MSVSTNHWSILLFSGEITLVALIVGGFLLVLLRRSRRQIERQRARIDALLRRQADAFLDRELIHTRDLLAGGDDRLRQLAELRREWLQAERQALMDAGAAASDTRVLLRAAAALMTRSGSVSAPAAIREGNDPRALSEQARAIIAVQKEIIDRLRKQLNRVVTGTDQPPAYPVRPDVYATLQRVDDNAETQREGVGRLERGLASARANFRQVSSELEGVRARASAPPSRQGGDGVLIVAADNTGLRLDKARSWIESMELSHAESLRELARMRDINARQRQLILQLEQEINEIRKNSQEHHAAQELLENLREQLRNYENCTATLESETAQLRSRIETLNRVIAEAERSGGLDVIQQLQEEIRAGSREHDEHARQVQAHRHLAGIAAADSVEQASPHLLAWLRDLQVPCAVYMRGGGRQFWLSGDNHPVEARIRQLLPAMMPNAEAPWTDVQGGSIFVGTCVRLYVQGDDAHVEPIRHALTAELATLNALMAHLDHESNQDERMREQQSRFDQLRQQFSRIDTQHRYLSEENARVVTKMHDELQTCFSALTLTEIQRACIEGLLTDFEAEMALLVQASHSIEQQLQHARELLSPAAGSGNGHDGP